MMKYSAVEHQHGCTLGITERGELGAALDEVEKCTPYGWYCMLRGVGCPVPGAGSPQHRDPRANNGMRYQYEQVDQRC